MVQFVGGNPVESPGQKPSKRQRMDDSEQPRAATLDWLKNLNNALREGVGYGLSRWIPEAPRDPEDDLQEGEEDSGFAVGCFDQEQKQWCGAFFLTNVLDGLFFWIHGPVHRRCNDADRGLARAGKFSTWLLRLFEANVLFGPWNGAAWFRVLQAVATEAAMMMTADDPLLMFLWHRICDDHKWVDPKDTDRDARVRFIASLPQCPVVVAKPTKCAASKFLSVLTHIRKTDAYFHTKLLLAILCCIFKGWVQTWESLFNPAPKVALAAAKALEIDVEAAAAPVAAPDVVGPAEVAAPKKKAKGGSVAHVAEAKAAVKQDLQSIIRGSSTLLHAMTRVMGDANLIRDSRLVQFCMDPIGKEHGACLTSLKTPDGTLQYYISEACSGWLDTLKEMLRDMVNLVKLGRLGVTVDFPANVMRDLTKEDSRVVGDDATAHSIWKTSVCLISERASSGMRYSGSFPFRLAPIASDDVEVANAALADLKEAWAAFVSARKVMAPSVQNLVARCSLQGRAMADMARWARQANYERKPCIVDRVRRLFSGPLCDKMIEDANKQLREDETRGSTNKELKAYAAWESPINGRVLESYGRQEIDADNHAAPIPATDDVSKSLFKFDGDGDPDKIGLHRILGKQDWVTFDAQGAKTQPSIDSLLLDMLKKDDYTLACNVWRSACIPLLTLILHRPKEAVGALWLSLYCNEYGVLGWPVHRRGDRFCYLDVTVKKLQFYHIYAFEEYECVPFIPVSPVHVQLNKEVPLHLSGVLLEPGHPVPVLQFQASRGFAGVAEKHLRLLADEEGVQPLDGGGIADLETLLAMALVQKLMPDQSHEELTETMLKRQYVDDSHHDEDPWKFISCGELEEVCSRSDRQVIKGFAKGIEKVAKRRDEQTIAVKEMVRRAFDGKPGGPKHLVGKPKAKAKGGKPGHIGCDNRWWASVCGDAEWVEQNKPPKCCCLVDDWNGRYRVSYPAMGVERSISWTKRTVRVAALEALHQMWVWHKLATGEDPPIPLELV
jgi:hypothetical protein